MISKNESFWLSLITSEELPEKSLEALHSAILTKRITWTELGRRAESHWGFRFLSDLSEITSIHSCRGQKGAIAYRLTFKTSPRLLLLRSPSDWNEFPEMDELNIQPAITSPALMRRLETQNASHSSNLTSTYDSQQTSDYLTHCLKSAKQLRASDWHIEKRRNGYLNRLRIDGKLCDSDLLPLELGSKLVNVIKSAAKLPLDHHPHALEGQFAVSALNLSLRIVVFPTLFGESLALRLLPLNPPRHKLTDLGMKQPIAEEIIKNLARPGALLICVGPTGSGKSTTLHCLIENHLQSSQQKILSVEDPVEIPLSNVTQMEVNPTQGVTFASATRAFLRQSPDLILVGEIRDNETAATVYEAVLCGHRVLTTLHANSPKGALERLSELHFPTDDPALPPLFILQQQLIPIPCPYCSPSSKPAKSTCQICYNRQTIGRTGDFQLAHYSNSRLVSLDPA